MIERFQFVLVKPNRLLKVFNGLLVIAHILVHEAPLDVVGRVFGQQLLNFRKLLQCLAEQTFAAKEQS